MKLTIDRKIWLRGEGCGLSYLFRPKDGKMCCVGIYLKALGAAESDISGRATAADLGIIGDPFAFRGLIPAWLVTGGENSPCSTDVAAELYEVNDDPDIEEADRELFIKESFAAQGVEVEFTN